MFRTAINKIAAAWKFRGYHGHRSQLPGDDFAPRLTLSVLTTASYLLVIVAMVSFGDATFGLCKEQINFLPLPQLVLRPFYFLGLPLFLILMFLPPLIKRAIFRSGKHTRSSMEPTVRFAYVFLAIMVVALPAWFLSKHNQFYLLIFVGIAFGWALTEFFWSHPFVEFPFSDKTPDSKKEDRIKLLKVNLEFLKFEDERGWRPFNLVWTVLIAIVFSAIITLGASVRPDINAARSAQYLSAELGVLFLAGFLVLPGMYSYYVNKSNYIHARMSETYREIHNILIPKSESGSTETEETKPIGGE